MKIQVERRLVAAALHRQYQSTWSIFSVIEGAKELGEKARKRASSEFQDMVSRMSAELKISKEQIAQALAEPSTVSVLKSFGYSVKAMAKCINAAGVAVHNGVMSAMETVHKTAVGQKLHARSKELDALLDKHPVVKKVTGPVIAGLLAYQWLNMSYIGAGDLDFDAGYIGEALAGNYKIADLVTSPDGMANMAYVATLVASGGALSFPYLIKDSIGVAVAVTYSAVKHADKIPGLSKLKTVLKGKLDIIKQGTIPRQRSQFADWWDRLSKRGKQEYLREHPKSSYKV